MCQLCVPSCCLTTSSAAESRSFLLIRVLPLSIFILSSSALLIGFGLSQPIGHCWGRDAICVRVVVELDSFLAPAFAVCCGPVAV